MNLETRLEKLFRQHGLRMTQPRRIVFEFLVNAKEPVKLHQVIDLQGNWADRASLYRTIKLYKDLGVIREVHRSGGEWLELGEAFSSHHHHITCVDCGLSQTITSPQIEQHLKQIASETGYSVLDHQLELTGRCPDCLATRSN